MSLKLEGKIQKVAMGSGTWSLATADQTYEIHDIPDDLKQDDLSVKVTGKVRDDVMTFAMIGPVLQIDSYEVQ